MVLFPEDPTPVVNSSLDQMDQAIPYTSEEYADLNARHRPGNDGGDAAGENRVALQDIRIMAPNKTDYLPALYSFLYCHISLL